MRPPHDGRKNRQGTDLLSGPSEERRPTKLQISQQLMLRVTGVTVGLGAAVGLGRYIESMLFGIAPLDASTFAAVGGALIMTTALAAFLPSRRATHVNPVSALRSE